MHILVSILLSLSLWGAAAQAETPTEYYNRQIQGMIHAMEQSRAAQDRAAQMPAWMQWRLQRPLMPGAVPVVPLPGARSPYESLPQYGAAPFSGWPAVRQPEMWGSWDDGCCPY